MAEKFFVDSSVSLALGIAATITASPWNHKTIVRMMKSVIGTSGQTATDGICPSRVTRGLGAGFRPRYHGDRAANQEPG
jgi:hypothetical protein